MSAYETYDQTQNNDSATTTSTSSSDGFGDGYQVTSVNPGWPLLAFTIAYGVAVVYFVPTLVFIQRRNEWYKKLKQRVRKVRMNLQEKRDQAKEAAEREAAKMGTTISNSAAATLDVTPYTLAIDDEPKEQRAKHTSEVVVRKGLKKGRQGVSSGAKSWRKITVTRPPKSESRLVAQDDVSVDSYSSVAKSLFLGIDDGRMGTREARSRDDQMINLPTTTCEEGVIKTPPRQVYADNTTCTCQTEVSIPPTEDTTTQNDDVENTRKTFTNPNKATKQTLSFYDVFDKRVTLWDMLRPDENIVQVHRTATPWIVQGLLDDAGEIIVVALLSRFVGEDAMLAYVAVELVLGIFSALCDGVYDAAYRHSSIAVSAGDKFLAGQYIQISILYTFVAGVPTLVFALLFVDEALSLLGFSQNVVDVAHRYSIVWAISSIVENFDESWSALLDIGNEERFGVLLDFYQTIIEITISVLALAVFNVNSLFLVSIFWLAGTLFFTWRKITIVHRSGKLWPFYEGLLSNSLRNISALKILTQACIPAVIQCFLFDIEWRLFTLIASFIGPAEAASWIILGKVWKLSETAVENFSEAVAPKIASFLVAGDIVMGRALAYKSLFAGALYGTFSSCILVVLGPLIVNFMTKDSTLENLLRELLPYVIISNPFISVGTVASSLSESQGQNWVVLWTYLGNLCLVSLPLAGFFTIVLDYNAEGLAAAMVAGYCTSACIQLNTFIESDVNKAVERVKASAEAGELGGESLFSAESLDGCSTDSDSEGDSIDESRSVV